MLDFIGHNDLVKHFKQDKKYGFINDGDKIRWVYLKTNPLGLKVVPSIKVMKTHLRL